MALLGESGGNVPQRAPPTAERFNRQALRDGDDLRPALGVALAPLDLDAAGALALARALEFGDERRLLELRNGAEYLADQHRSRRVVEKGIRRVCSDEFDAK